MTDREKLIELIGNVQDEGMDYSDVVCAYRTSNERLADYLLANGVRLESKQATSDENKRWIPVTEKLPEDWVDVLVLSELDFCETAVYIGIPGKWRVTWNHDMLEKNSITHWMPLPEPPEKE